MTSPDIFLKFPKMDVASSIIDLAFERNIAKWDVNVKLPEHDISQFFLGMLIPLQSLSPAGHSLLLVNAKSLEL